jgi:dipeptidyl aminopeptidase/acylaminoacyl peptidase
MCLALFPLLLTASLSGCSENQGTPEVGSLEWGDIPLGWTLWSPTAESVAVTGRSPTRGTVVVYLVNAISLDVAMVSGTEGLVAVHVVSWSPDGSSLYVRALSGFEGPDPIWSVWSINIAEVDSIPEYFMDAHWISWSAQADLAFVREGNKTNPSKVYVQGAASDSEVLIYEDSENTVSQVYFSPDGKNLALIASEEPERRTDSLYILEVSTGDIVAIAHNISGVQASWHPSGEWIAYVARVSISGRPESEIRFLSLDGNCDSLLPNSVGFSSPSWSPDGNSLAVIDDGEFRIIDLASYLGEDLSAFLEKCP